MKNVEILAETVARLTKALYSADTGDIPDDQMDTFAARLAAAVSAENRKKAKVLELVQRDANLADDEKAVRKDADKANAEFSRLVLAKSECVEIYKKALADLKAYNASIKDVQLKLEDLNRSLADIQRRREETHVEYLKLTNPGLPVVKEIL